LAIALVHILPEVVDDYHYFLHPVKQHSNGTIETSYNHSTDTKLSDEKYFLQNEPSEQPIADFPLPYILYFCGYTLILLVDKVIFDSDAFFTEERSED